MGKSFLKCVDLRAINLLHHCDTFGRTSIEQADLTIISFSFQQIIMDDLNLRIIGLQS